MKQERVAAGLTVRELADAVGRSVAYIAKIETGGEIPNADFICLAAGALGQEPTSLLRVAKEARLARLEREIELRETAALARYTDTSTVVERKEPRMAKAVSLINMKGGVGKTTVASQLAHAADRLDIRVLAVDLDPQSNLSQAILGPAAYAEHLKKDRPTVAQIFEGYIPPDKNGEAPRPLDLDEVILEEAGYWAGTTLDLIPSRLELSRTLKNPFGKERRLAKALSHVSDRYDLILIDCAPTESMLTEAAYHASRYVIVPVKPEFMATIGLPLLARSLREFQAENDDHEIEIAGLVFNHSSTYSTGPEGQTSIREVRDEAKKNGWPIFQTQINYSASYAKAAREGTPLGVTSYARGNVVNQFNKLRDEIFETLELRERVTS
jgi:chromosome partitioning protein